MRHIEDEFVFIIIWMSILAGSILGWIVGWLV